MKTASVCSVDLAGCRKATPTYFTMRSRIVRLLNRYVTVERLSDHLSDLPSQFTDPHQRPWELTHWKAIDRNQIVGIDPEVFLQVLAGAAEIEAPIREYSKESRDYLVRVHPQMAQFMGGEYTHDGTVVSIGIWEKEERQHAPLFSKLYQQFTGQKLTPKSNSVEGCHPTDDPWTDLHQHLVSRITTEWSAASIYLWLMAHSTGELQKAIAQPLQDEINHLAKFWGFSRWAFGDSFLQQVKGAMQNLLPLLKHHKGERTHGKDLLSHTRRINNAILAVEIIFTLVRLMNRLRIWNKELSDSYLRYLFGSFPVVRSCQTAA